MKCKHCGEPMMRTTLTRSVEYRATGTLCLHEAIWEPGERDAMVEQLASAFHESYERLAPNFRYKTRKASAVPWEQVPPKNADLMRAVCRELLDGGLVDVKLRNLWRQQLRHADDDVQSRNGSVAGVK